jgi:hypothetical protein
MPKVLTHAEYLTIRRGLAAGRRQTEIARELNMSVWTIARIADRRRFVSDDELNAGELPPNELCEDDSPPDYVAQNLRRCPDCGAMVYLWPCLACCHGVSALAVTKPESTGEPNPPPTRGPQLAPRSLKQKLLHSRRSQVVTDSPLSNVEQVHSDHPPIG